MFDKWKTRVRGAAPPLTVLALMTSDSDRELLRDVCMGAGWKIILVDNLAEGLGQPAGIVLCDRDLTGIDWRGAIRQLAISPHPRRVILASYVVDDYLWDEVIHCGGYDVLPKPFRVHEVVHTIQFAWAAVTKSHPSAPRIE
jgi:DNA-binding NarL/FixJ family response regulator